MEFASADLPAVEGALGLRLRINGANYERWSMYAVYELELYDLPEHGELPTT
jgi:hypothetical protein